MQYINNCSSWKSFRKTFAMRPAKVFLPQFPENTQTSLIELTNMRVHTPRGSRSIFFGFSISTCVSWAGGQPLCKFLNTWGCNPFQLKRNKEKWFICKVLRKRNDYAQDLSEDRQTRKKKNDQMSPLLLSLLPHLHLHLNASAQPERLEDASHCEN